MSVKDLFPLATRTDKVFSQMAKMERWQGHSIGQVRTLARKEAMRQLDAEKEAERLLAVPTQGESNE